MGRAPCCDKMGVKKGPWSPEEDRILVSYIIKHGFGNWRALPKQAGLLRCGKSCRLRWTNYLRPDLKRGNLSPEEERTVIKLHEVLGNKWSAIASYLPGRTDNEIKNIWNTHIKKRFLSKSNSSSSSSSNSSSVPSQSSHTSSSDVSHPPSSPSSSSSFMSTTDPLNHLHYHWAQSSQQNVSVQDSPTLSRIPCDFHEQKLCMSAAAQQQQSDKKEATKNIDEFLLGNLNAPPSCRSEDHPPSSLMAHYNPESRVSVESQNILGFDDEEIFRAEEQGFILQEDDQALSNAASNTMEFDPNRQFPDFSSLESFLSEPIEVDEYMVSSLLWFEQELHN